MLLRYGESMTEILNDLAVGEWIGLISLAVAVFLGIPGLILAWLAHKRERDTDPWKLTKLNTDVWELERRQKMSVWITHLLNFSGAEVQVLNGAGAPVFPYERGKKVSLRISPSIPGTQLTVFYRPVTRKERVDDLNIAPEYNTPDGMDSEAGIEFWSASVY